MSAGSRDALSAVTERFVDVPRASLYTRSLGAGDAVVVLHGGPGHVDHTYLLPHMDRLADVCRLVYVDQRGHGRSLGNLDPSDITATRFVDDLARVCDALDLTSPTLLGHSWGAHLALRFALRHPDRPRRLILMNTGPVSKVDHDDFVAFRRKRGGHLIEEQRDMMASRAYAEADPTLEADLVRRTFSIGIRRPIDVARIQLRLTRENVLRGRMIAQGFEETLFSQPFDLLPDLTGLRIPTLVVHGEHDFVPVAAAEHVARALPDARLIVIPECGHFAYLEAADVVHAEVAGFTLG